MSCVKWILCFYDQKCPYRVCMYFSSWLLVNFMTGWHKIGGVDVFVCDQTILQETSAFDICF